MLLGIESGWTIETWMILALFVMCAVLSFFGLMAAYRNGVVDGYGYSKEPGHRGYKHAGEILRETMYHRWYELREKAGDK
jgi:hypothetical protein